MTRSHAKITFFEVSPDSKVGPLYPLARGPSTAHIFTDLVRHPDIAATAIVC